jgi:hypothetical protein
MTPEAAAGQVRPAVFLSVVEGQTASLAQPFRDLLRPSAEGYIVSDLPLVGDAYSPRPLTRGVDRSVMVRGIIEEGVLADLEADLAFVDRVLERVDPGQRASHVIPVAALIGATYTAWRTRAEQAASPNWMSMNMSGGGRIVTHLSSPAQPRAALLPARVDGPDRRHRDTRGGEPGAPHGEMIRTGARMTPCYTTFWDHRPP